VENCFGQFFFLKLHIIKMQAHEMHNIPQTVILAQGLRNNFVDFNDQRQQTITKLFSDAHII